MFTANDVKTLREKTGAGMLDCKKALDASNGDMEKAVEWLRENGIAKAAKKQSRIAAEGTTKILEDDNSAIIIEVNAETDFAASNENFTSAVERIAEVLLPSDANTLEEANKVKIDDITIEEFMVNLTATIGEKLTFRRFERVTKEANDVLGLYSHMGGKIGVIVKLDGGTKEVAKDVAMQVAAMNPSYKDRDSVPTEDLEHEKTMIKEEIKNDPKNASKPENIIEKMSEGRIEKFYKENCLVDQAFFKDDSKSVGGFLKENNSKIKSYVRFQVGEGIEKKEENFAEEVRAQMEGK